MKEFFQEKHSVNKSMVMVLVKKYVLIEVMMIVTVKFAGLNSSFKGMVHSNQIILDLSVYMNM